MSAKKEHKGISLRTVYIWLIISAVLLGALMFASTFFLSAKFQDVTTLSEQHIKLRKDALELMDASDYLTENVQRFTVEGDMHFLNEYFKEAFEMQHRENAIEKMSSETDSTIAIQKLQDALDGSNALMSREYYAMRLVIEAKGYTEYPEELQSVKLSTKDKALSAQDKMRLATEMVLDNEYYAQKNQIRKNMRWSLDEIEKEVNESDTAALDSLRKELLLVRSVIVLQAIGVIFLVWLTSHLGIHPILRAVEKIKKNSRLQESGAREFRYLVRSYNKMYDMYQRSLERLNFKASHDELTGVLNRAGYESVLEAVELDSTCLFLLDIDNFKGINDTYGHEIGDKALIKAAQVLKKNFRPDDYICRIGGDEFVVFMCHTPTVEKDMLAAKMDAINAELGIGEEDLPPISMSIGIVHGSDVSGTEDVLVKVDEAMYRAKQKGKHTYSFS